MYSGGLNDRPRPPGQRERNLWAAVLEQAFDDLLKGATFGEGPSKVQERRDSAIGWVGVEDYEFNGPEKAKRTGWYGANFRVVCDILDLDPAAVRKEFKIIMKEDGKKPHRGACANLLLDVEKNPELIASMTSKELASKYRTSVSNIGQIASIHKIEYKRLKLGREGAGRKRKENNVQT